MIPGTPPEVDRNDQLTRMVNRWKLKKKTISSTPIEIYFETHFVYIYIYIYMGVGEREREREREKLNERDKYLEKINGRKIYIWCG